MGQPGLAAVFEEMMGYADADTFTELIDLILRGQRPKRKKRTPGKYLFAGAATGAALSLRYLIKRRRLRRQQQENRPEGQKMGGKPIDRRESKRV